ncbi:MAG: DNA-directed RNA polymerase subunit beta [Desulfobacterota bacterium]|nr:DNA-directed RNA polymerase subunit beta [Thermodesulfobacteriota bacterium]
MSTIGTQKLRFRKSFKETPDVMTIPNLIDIQKRSYDAFLQKDIVPQERKNCGLQRVFQSVFPIKNYNESSSLEFVSYTLGQPKYDIDECRQKELTYAAPLKVLMRLVNYDAETKNIRDIKEQEVYFGEIPLMTEQGTFIINGTERVVVSQLHRSPGVFFDHDKGKNLSSGKFLYSARIIPSRGSWIDFEFDPKDIIYVRIDRRRKFPVTVLLKALGMSEQELLRYFYTIDDVSIENGTIRRTMRSPLFGDVLAHEDIIDPKTKAVLVKKGRKITRPLMKKIREAKISWLTITPHDLLEKPTYVAEDLLDPATGEVLLPCNGMLTKEILDRLMQCSTTFKILFIDHLQVDSSFRDTLALDKVKSPESAIVEIYRRLRPNDPPSQESANLFFNKLFFDSEYYELTDVGRLKINERLNLATPLDVQVLTKEDILETVRMLIEIKSGRGDIDDIDHLGNRRVRTVGELVESHYRIGLVRMERAIKERMSLQEVETLMPNDLVNSKMVSAVIKEFFGSSQLSQFMDQTNPLAEITHKRRLSALGPGGLTRERAGFEVRDVHPTHYGRICPIETPEGPNIGLIASLSTYAQVNQYGFIETPYRKVERGKVTDKIEYLTAHQEEKFTIAQANAPIDDRGRFTTTMVSARRGGEFVMASPDEIDYMDVSPKQLVSVAASLIPFLENDDANRALMGSNMQRQAVPLLRTEAPLIGTGMERVAAKDSGVVVVARRNGVVRSVDAERIVIKHEDDDVGIGSDVDIYKLTKYRRSNQNTCINQKPIVRVGDYVEAGDIIADGPATEMGELALGRNVLVAFMPWGGYNFEDSILVSEKLIREDTFTSIHIEEFEVLARDTKLGKEEITRDIPNVGEDMLANLDESGIVRIGAEVKAGDILVGKITPKGETQLSPEEKLLRAIFGEKARDVQDTSLRVPTGVEGTVISVNIFSRKGVDKDERTRSIEDEERARLLKDQEDQIRILRESVNKRLKKMLVGKVVAKKYEDEKKKKVIFPKHHVITEEDVDRLPISKWVNVPIVDGDDLAEKIEKIKDTLDEEINLLKVIFEEKIEKIKQGDELPPGVIKMVKVCLAVKRKLSVGDKMAGRHGNKGVLSRILPIEDMPYLADGTPVDIVLNPLGVPSRMNVGQILETHLGWAAKGLGAKVQELLNAHVAPEKLRKKIKEIFGTKEVSHIVDGLDDDQVLAVARKLGAGIHMASPVFEGVKEPQINTCLEEAGLPVTGQALLFDGRTGELFDREVTVGVIYMMKLHHLVDDKIHARSIGTYSLVTQQPLGGKAQFGGQRLGEMEVWALEAYGAAHALQEFLTLKSDDVFGRTKLYENIVKGELDIVPSIPESFNVLVKELQSLCLDVQFIETEKKND